MKNVMIRGLLATSLPLLVIGAAWATENAADPTKSGASAMCAQMLQESSPEGQQAMEEFMESGRAPQAMASMMDMACRMGGATRCSE